MMQAFDSIRQQALRLFGIRLSDGYGILGVTLVDQTGAAVTIGGGSGGGDASAANQALQLAQETATATSTATTATALAASVTANSGGLATSLVVKAAAGKLRSLTVFNNASFGQYYQLHDSATLPAEAAVPRMTLFVPAKANGSFDYGQSGRPFAAGIVACNSSTAGTKTIGAADSIFDAQYV